jgi:hypothetical protein
MNPWSPSFNPLKDSLSSTLVLVRLPNIPSHFWSLSSLCAIGNALGRCHFRIPKKKNFTICTYDWICVEMDFNKGFSVEIILTRDNYSWIQILNYEKITLKRRDCFTTGHSEAQCLGGPKKSQKQHKWVGSHIDHQVISKEYSSDVHPPKEGSKEASVKANDAPSNEDASILNPPLDDSKSKIEDTKVT